MSEPELVVRLRDELERSKRQAEEAIVVFAQLSQLQALVRALLNELDDATFVDSRGYRYATYKEDVVLGNLDTAIKLVRATLDATTPDSNQLGDINDMVSKGGNGE